MSSTRRDFLSASAAAGAAMLAPGRPWSKGPEVHPLEQKIGRLFFLNMFWSSVPDFFLDIVERYRIGGVYLDTKACQDRDTIAKNMERLRSAAQGPLFIITDFESSAVNRLRKIHPLPKTSQLGADLASGKMSEQDFYRHYQEKAAFMAGLGFDFNFDPVLDLDGSFIHQRSLGRDPGLVSRAARIILAAYREAGVHAAAKHFPGLGGISQDPHQKVLPVIKASLEELAPRDLAPFRTAIAEKVSSILVAHVMAPALDPDLPASLSDKVIDGYLRGELGYKGVVWPDSLSMGAVKKLFLDRGAKEAEVDALASVAAIRAGCDLIFNFRFDNSQFPRLAEEVRSAIERSELLEDRLDASLERIGALQV